MIMQIEIARAHFADADNPELIADNTLEWYDVIAFGQSSKGIIYFMFECEDGSIDFISEKSPYFKRTFGAPASLREIRHLIPSKSDAKRPATRRTRII